MIKKIASYLLSCRLENVMAGGLSLGILLLIGTTRLFKTFSLGMHDFVFLLLPVSVLLFRALLQSLITREEETEPSSTTDYIRFYLEPFQKIFHDWLPFLLLSACYFSLYSNLILRVNPNCVDTQLAAIDERLFGSQPAFLLEPWIHPRITDFFNLIYFSYVLYFPGIALYFYLKEEYKPFRRIMMGYLTLILLGVTSYIIFPAVGPEKFFASQFTRDLQGESLSRGISYIMGIKVAHDCFPSLHVGLILLIALYLREYRPRVFPLAVLYVILMTGSTIYLRYHYVIDVLAAFPFVIAAYRLTDWLLRVWPGERVLEVIPPPPARKRMQTSGS